MKEEIIGFGKNASLVGVLTPARAGIERRDIGVVFLNAVIIHKIGPNRLYVKLARCFAREGFTCFRFDFSGIGDSRILNSNEPNIFDPMFEVGQAMDCLQITTGIAKFILLGVCSGAEMAFRAASRDTRIIGLSLIDGIYLDNQVLNYIYPQAVQRTRLRDYLILVLCTASG